MGGIVPTAIQAIEPAIIAVRDVERSAQRPSVEESADAAARAEFCQSLVAFKKFGLRRSTSAPEN
jgi:hypothetical protein